MKKLKSILFTLIFTSLFISCTNEISGLAKNDPLEYSIRCSISQNLDDSNIARTAFPSAATETFSYMLYFNCGNESFSKKVEAYDGSDFGIKIPHKGLWEVRAYGSINGDPVSSTEYILRSERIYYLNVTDENPSPFQKIIVKPVMTSGAMGDISLQVEWDADTDINLAECVCPALESLGGYNFNVNAPDAQLFVYDVPSGSYTVDFNFYKVEGEAKILKYNATEIINVYDGFTTDTWVKHGDDDHLVVNTTPPYVIFEVTKELTRKFVNSTVYVDSNVAADAIQTGSFIAPFKTFDQAWALVGNNFNNENMASCTIYLRGDSTEHKVSAGTSTYNIGASKKLTVKSWDASSPAVLVSEGTGSFFTNAGTLVLDNVVIDGNNVDRVNTVYGIDNSGSVDLINTTIRNFKISSVRYTINVGATGSLSVSGKTVIIDNVCKNNGNKRNIYIPTGAVLTVKGITSDSRIGISVPNTVEGGTAQNPNSSKHAVFTSGYVAFNSLVKTDEVFISDAGYYPAVDPSTGEAALYASGGRIIKNGYDIIEIKCLKSKIVNPTSANESGRTVLFNLYNNTTGEDLTSKATWNFTVKYLGADLPKTTYWTSNSNSVVFKENLGYDIYNIAATATVDGLSYTTTHDVEVYQVNSVASLGETAPTATAASPVTISVSTQAELKKISDWTRDQKHLENVTIILEKDIECTNYQSFGMMKSAYAADPNKVFSGTLEGNGHTIKINSFSSDSKALIAGTSSAVVKNLILEGDIETLESYVCGFVLYPQGTTIIIDCINRMNITSSGTDIYGFSVRGQTDKLTIERCRNEGNLTGEGNNVAGIATNSQVGGSIKSCVNTGTITGQSNVGGITSGSTMNILNCINTGNITGQSYVGGIAGVKYCSISNDAGKLANCLNMGAIASTYGNVGGIVGAAGNASTGNFKKAVIVNCVNLGPVSCNSPTATSVGNIIGYKYNDNDYTIKNNFYLDQNSYKGIGGTDDELSSGIETTSFVQTKASCVAYVPNSAYGASSKDVVDMLNIWIKSASGGNDSSFKTYVKWVYKTDSSGKAFPYLTEVK